MLLGWVFFRAADLPRALAYFASMFGFGHAQPGAVLLSGILYKPYYLLSIGIAALVVWAGPLGYRERSLYGNFWQLVERHEVATMSAVPTVYAALAQVPVDADISSLVLPIVGAAPLPPS